MKRRSVLAALSSAGVALTGCQALPPVKDTVRRDDGHSSTNGEEWTQPFRVTNFQVTREKVGPEHRWYAELLRAWTESVVSEESPDANEMAISEIEDADARAFVKRVIHEDDVAVDDVPDGLPGLVERVDFFTQDESDGQDERNHFGIRVYEAYPNREPVLQFDAELEDPIAKPGDPSVVTFTVENTGDQTYHIYSGVVPPFSLVWADGPQDRRVLLWHDYRSFSGVDVTEEHAERNMVLLTTPLEPGESITKDYQIRADQPQTRALAPGHWEISNHLRYRRQYGAPANQVELTASFDVESA